MIGIALIGCGYWGKNVAKTPNKSRLFDLKCICDSDQDNLKEARAFFGEKIEYEEDYKVVASKEDIQCVAIATQTETHFDIAKYAMQKGKHVYVEKPVTLNSKDADKLHRISKDKNLVLHVDHIMVYSPAVMKAKDLVENGKLGEMLHIDCSRVNLGIARKDVNVMWDLSIHDLSIVDYLLGGEIPRQILAVGARGGFPQETTTSLSLAYKKSIATIRASWLSPVKERKITIYGTDKTLVIDDTEQTDKMTLYSKRLTEDGKAEISGDSTIMAIKAGEPLLNSIEHFGRCIEKHEESMTNAKSASRLLKILEMADKQIG